MDAAATQVWQMGAGDAGRLYVEELLRYGVALIGPGDPGPFADGLYEDEPAIRPFAREVRRGDIVLLRTGRRRVHAVGVVAGDYEHLESFGDVRGWDLQHARRVRWFALPRPEDLPADYFGPVPRRFSRVHDPEACRYARAFVSAPPIAWQAAPLPALPTVEPELSPDELPVELRDVHAQAKDLAHLYYDVVRFGSRPAEMETVAHFVVPLLRALGWPPELIAVEWRRIDVAVFDRRPRQAENLRLVVEAKQFGAGIEGALEQAQGYLRDVGVERDVLVTDGLRYRLFAASGAFQDVAYANLARPRTPALRLFAALRRAKEV